MLVSFAALVVVSLVFFCLQKYTRFITHRVKHYFPLPLLGNIGPVVIRQKHFCEVFNDVYNGFPEERFVGMYEFASPVIVVRDLELVRKITIFDFDHFLTHRPLITEDVDPLFARGVMLLKGAEWKDMRLLFMPGYTSAKIKSMLPIFVQKSEQVANRIKKDIEKSKSKFLDMDVKLLAKRFVVDVEATVFFEKTVDSFSDPGNIYCKMFRSASKFGYIKIMKMLGCYSSSYLMKLLNITFFTTDEKAFFTKLVLGTINEIEEGSDGTSLIHLLKKAQKEGWNETDIIAQAILFIYTVLNTIPSTLSFLLYELACNPGVQEKVVQEIRTHRKTNGQFDYNTIQSMTYLDMVVSETLRLWPPLPATDRLCASDYNLGKPNDESTNDFILTEGEDVVIPIMAIHRDPQYFSDPLKFDPERFLEENKDKIKPYTYMPFGVGPKNCIGASFAKCLIKSLLVNLLEDIEVVPNKRTTIPPRLSMDNFTLALQGGHWLRMKLRKGE